MEGYHLLAVITIDLIYTRSYFERVPSSSLFPTNADKVFSLMNKIRKSKPTGLDRISVRLIRECTELICVPMCDLFNHSFRQGKLPEDCKSVRVAPLFKQDDGENVNGLRPASVIPVAVGVLERIVYGQLYVHFEEQDKLCKHQSCFRAIHSTVTALLKATDFWAYNINIEKINGVIFLELKKSLDNVDHNILLSKLDLYGISGNRLKWLLSYLENCARQCSVSGPLTNSRVPKGEGGRDHPWCTVILILHK